MDSLTDALGHIQVCGTCAESETRVEQTRADTVVPFIRLESTDVNIMDQDDCMIKVYDLGKFMFDYFYIIKAFMQAKVHILQVPLEPRDSDFEIDGNLEKVKMDVVFPSWSCNRCFPCKHSVHVHMEGDAWNKWYKYNRYMSGDYIWKNYRKLLPKSMIEHFKKYD